VTRDRPSIVEFVRDPQLLNLALSLPEEALLRLIYGLALSDAQAEVARACTGRERLPRNGASNVTVVAGARAGKDSRVAGPVACFEALFGGHERRLGKGEVGIVALVAQDRAATRIAFEYIRHYFMASPLLRAQLAEELKWELVLSNRIRIRCFPCTARAPRGRTIVTAIMDEVAFFQIEGHAKSDAEIQAALRRGMGTVPGARLLKVSTPWPLVRRPLRGFPAWLRAGHRRRLGLARLDAS
jgi:hypothetical protein